MSVNYENVLVQLLCVKFAKSLGASHSQFSTAFHFVFTYTLHVGPLTTAGALSASCRVAGISETVLLARVLRSVLVFCFRL